MHIERIDLSTHDADLYDIDNRMGKQCMLFHISCESVSNRSKLLESCVDSLMSGPTDLHTSHSYENRRSELLNPPENSGMRRSGSTENLQKHVLSPRLVDAISSTAQVVWANTNSFLSM